MTETRSEPHTPTPAALTSEKTKLAARSSRALAAYLNRSRRAQLQLVDDNASFGLPESALPLLQTLLEQLSQGHAVAVVPLQAELTTQQAADMLNVSRPYLVKCLEQGDIPFRLVGSRRRLRLNDVLHYKQHQDDQRRRALEALVDQAEELDMGY